MSKIKQIKDIRRQHLLNKSKLIDVAKSNAITELLDIFNINYSVIDADGNYIMQNNSMVSDISQGNIKAQSIDARSWADCEKVIQSRTRKVVEEEFNGRYYLSVKQPVVSDDESIGIIILSFDITERKQAEIAKEEFLANMSHDFRIPFSGITSMAGYLLDSETDPVKKEFLSTIAQSSKSFLHLLNQILELSSSSNENLRCTDFNIHDELIQVVNMFQAELKTKDLSLSFDCPDTIVNTDKLKLSKILMNLLGNAIKFTELGSIKIYVEFNPMLTMTVKDTGMGISDEHQKHVFDKFYKVTPSNRTGAFKGSGLGLHIVQKTVKELGGFITLQSELGKGSSFTVSLPVKELA